MPFVSLTSFNSRWVLALLTPSLHIWIVCLYSSWIPAPTSFMLHFYVQVQSGAPCSSYRSPNTFYWFLDGRGGPLRNLEEVIPEHQPLSWTPVFSRASSRRILQSRSLNRPKSVLLRSRLVVLLFALLPPLRILNSVNAWSLQPRLPPVFPSPNSSSLMEVWGAADHTPLLSPLSLVLELSSMHYRKLLDCLCPAALPPKQLMKYSACWVVCRSVRNPKKIAKL